MGNIERDLNLLEEYIKYLPFDKQVEETMAIAYLARVELGDLQEKAWMYDEVNK